MPRPTQRGWLPVDAGAVAWLLRIRHLRKGVKKGAHSREGPPAKSDREEACDERSRPQEVTSSWVRHGGVNLQQEVVPQQTERPPRDFPKGGYSRRGVGGMN